MEDEREITSALHARRKNRSPIGKLSCCFNADHRRATSLFDISSNLMPSPNRRSPSSWIRTKHFMPRMGKHRRHSSADFSYDPLSYALNFEDGINDDPSEGEDPTRKFSSRLPATPPRATMVASEPLPGKILSVSRGTSDQLSSSRVTGVAEDVQNLEPSPAEMRRMLELPTPRRPSDVSRRSTEMPEPRKQSHEVPMQRKVVPTAQDGRSTEQSTSRAAAVAEVRSSLELEDVTPRGKFLLNCTKAHLLHRAYRI